MNTDMLTSQIKIIVGSQVFEATLYDNPTSLSLIEQMPFTVELEDYAGKEKIFHPIETLSKTGAPKGADPKVGDIMCYGPWGNIAIFYKNVGYASGLIPMGQMNDIDGFVKALASNSSATFKEDK
ncbi:hypothetical protein JMN32_19435 [Fulvivirga sp. 29W222]|uniref:Cyclophilin-like domain-containing protein n=1 Tax=Fulvivirga marina TaxID=2494733 RepID=A0A937G0P7_9BACT|nr:cyclophilin-like fold protein [Fulvivirga marina]MBL6448492.1 hypothetical protein [Fulvivirga marina]